MTGINDRLSRLREIYAQLLALSSEARSQTKTPEEVGREIEQLAYDLRDEMMLLVFVRRE